MHYDMCAFPKCGLEFKPSTGITTHHKSFHGGDFKQWAQMCLFIDSGLTWMYQSNDSGSLCQRF